MSDTTSERRVLRSKWPDAFDDGARCGSLRDPNETPSREPGGYPGGFLSWPLEMRNGWIAGFNFSYSMRGARHG